MGPSAMTVKTMSPKAAPVSRADRASAAWAVQRQQMVERQIVGRGVSDPMVLDAMREVPRHAFVPPELEEFAHADAPLPIAAGQTISQPYIVALMVEALGLRPGD